MNIQTTEQLRQLQEMEQNSKIINKPEFQSLNSVKREYYTIDNELLEILVLDKLGIHSDFSNDNHLDQFYVDGRLNYDDRNLISKLQSGQYYPNSLSNQAIMDCLCDQEYIPSGYYLISPF